MLLLLAQDQWTPLIQASLDGNAGLVELLTKEGANRELHTKVSRGTCWTGLNKINVCD